MVHLFTELCLLDASRLPIDQLMPVLGKAPEGEGEKRRDGDVWRWRWLYYGFTIIVYYGFTMVYYGFTMGLLWVYYDFIKMIMG